MNNYLMKNNYIYYDATHMDSVLIEGIKNNFITYRLLGTEYCKINPDKKYSNIYIEDGFNDEEGFYNGILIFNNKDVCEITTSPYKLRIDNNSFTKIDAKVKENEFRFYAKKVSMADFKKNYIDEYFRYEIVVQNKIQDFDKCLNSNNNEKNIVNADNYYFENKKIEKSVMFQS